MVHYIIPNLLKIGITINSGADFYHFGLFNATEFIPISYQTLKG
jgi:hypothetical protein